MDRVGTTSPEDDAEAPSRLAFTEVSVRRGDSRQRRSRRGRHVARRSRPSLQLDLPARLIWALLIVPLFHGGLLFLGSYKGTYDAYVHLFLADHYARDWFSTWDQRWYTGFTTVSYPPGTHMTMAAVSKMVGLDWAFPVVQLATLLLLTIGTYRFARMWVDREASATAALLLVVSSTIAQTVHLYGQLPTTFALAFLLNALPFFKRWMQEGRITDLIVGTLVLAACTAGHHVTTLFGSVFFLGPVIVHTLLSQSRIPAPGEHIDGPLPVTRRTAGALIARRVRRILPHFLRGALLGPAVIGALALVVLPYWIWSATDPITQVSIPHGSRENFLADRNIGFVFFLIPWGLNLPLLPYTLVRGVVERMWPLVASIGLLFVLGTGGTTPIPRLLLGGAFDVLTLDRFTFWAAMMVLPLTGLFVKSIENGSVAEWLHRTGGVTLARLVRTGLIVAVLGFTLFSATLSRLRPFQPEPIATAPIVAFLEKDQHERWRYLTLGFGDQMAWLSAQTTAKQVDGNYHSVRRLPELTSTSVERLEGAKYRGLDGLGSLQQFLEVPEKYHLKYVFSNDKFYDPLLHFAGWHRLEPLDNGIMVWERADIPPLPAELPIREIPVWQRLLWGIVPPSAIVAALGALAWVGAGRPGTWPNHNVAATDARWLRGPFGWLDRRLRRLEQRRLGSVDALDDDAIGGGGGGSSTSRPSRAEAALADLRRRAARPIGRRRRFVRIALLLVIVCWWPIRIITDDFRAPDPTVTVAAYYDDLDFRRFNDAYERLDPLTRPDYEQWRLQLSVDGGLVASFAKLDDVAVEVVENDGAEGEVGDGDGTGAGTDRRVQVQADLRYLTALDWYRVEQIVDVVQRDGEWFLTPEPLDVRIPPDQFIRRPAVDYLSQGRRRVTSGTTDLIDVQDRPELFIKSARVVERNGLPSVVGEIINLDVDPADLTITAILRDDRMYPLARYNATYDIIHTLVPRESTPFRIDFEEVAAGDNLDFDPLDVHPIELDDGVVSAELYAKAVVTSGGLFRGLHVNDLQIVPDERGDAEGYRLVGELRNDGVREATVPLVLLSFLDDTGEVGWVEHVYLEAAIRSQRLGSFDIDLPALDDLTVSELPLREFHNGIMPTEHPIGTPPALIDLPEDHPFAQLRIDTAAFLGSGE